MLENPLVSIIINNFNYGDFIEYAIRSALDQTYPNCEVLVVDDGSTDHSIKVIEEYVPKVHLLKKENGGQASAFNLGVSKAKGEIVFFLDSDDFLKKSIVSEVVDHFLQNPELVKVQFRLQVVDQEGRAVDDTIPPESSAMPSGDLKILILTNPDDIVWQPTSGNAFRKSALSQIFPMPEEEYRICADYYLASIPALFGHVHSIEEHGGYYRVHSNNSHKDDDLDVEKSQAIIKRTQFSHTQLLKYAKKLKLVDPQVEHADFDSLSYLAHRMISKKLRPKTHPIKNDSISEIAKSGIVSSFKRQDIQITKKMFYISWFLLASISSQSIMRVLGLIYFYPEKRSLKDILNIFP